jgi:putative spermidine/putrescine transport system ATP-binding protein
MQEELKNLHQQLGITFIFVTHDQNEALSMADRIALFNEGRIMQVGTPQDIYRRPDSRFVADFVGSSNVLPPDFVQRLCGESRWASLRPEAIYLSGSGGHQANVIDASFLGGSTRLTLDLGSLRVKVMLASVTDIPALGERIFINWNAEDLHLMEAGE